MAEQNEVGRVQNYSQSDELTELVARGETITKQQTQYVTAVSVLHPRKLKTVEEMVKSEIELDPESTFYEWEVFDKRKNKNVPITGITIGTAMSIARNYGNCAVDIQVVETSTHYVFYPVFLDLETGFTFTRAFRQRKNQQIGSKFDKDRAEDIAFQIGQSKAIRNVVRGAVPSAFVNKSIDYAKQLISKDITATGIEKARHESVESFKKIGVSLEQLITYTGISDPEKWSVDVITRLRTAYAAIKNNDSSIEELFPIETATINLSTTGEPKTEPFAGDAEPKKRKYTRRDKPDTEPNEPIEPTADGQGQTPEPGDAPNLEIVFT